MDSVSLLLNDSLLNFFHSDFQWEVGLFKDPNVVFLNGSIPNVIVRIGIHSTFMYTG